MVAELPHGGNGFNDTFSLPANFSDGASKLEHLGISLPPSLAVVSFHQILLFSAALIAVPILVLVLQRYVRSGQQRRVRVPIHTDDCEGDEDSEHMSTSVDVAAVS